MFFHFDVDLREWRYHVCGVTVMIEGHWEGFDQLKPHSQWEKNQLISAIIQDVLI